MFFDVCFVIEIFHMSELFNYIENCENIVEKRKHKFKEQIAKNKLIKN